MIAEVVGQTGTVGTAYWAAFAVTGLICLLAISRAKEVEKTDIRRGLVGLLAMTGFWSLSKVVYFLAPDPYRIPAYLFGLVVGFGTVWAWLYFCSAYTNRSYHRNRTIQLVSVAVFGTIVAVKLTNPIHGLYFATTVETEPFGYLAIEHGLFHWAVTGLSYALAGIGIFVLFELFHNSGYNTRPLVALTGLLALPVLLDFGALFSSTLIEIIYAPIGVAAFVLGILYVYERRFIAVQSTGDEDDDAVVFLDGGGAIRDYTPKAIEFFPELEQAVGDQPKSVIPDAEQIQGENTRVIDHEVEGEQRYLLASANTVTLGESEGTVLLFSDVTRAETRRRELQRHNQQLEGFASALAHELRNMLQIIEWRLGLAKERTEEGTVESESIQKAREANNRLAARVDDFTLLTRYGQTVERMEEISFEKAVEDAWFNAETGDLSLEIGETGTIEADPGRLRELLANVFVFARLNDAETVNVELLSDGFAVADDGVPPGDDTTGYLEFGESVPTAEAGMKLPNARTFSEVHGWQIDIDSSYQEGVRVVISGAHTQRQATASSQ